MVDPISDALDRLQQYAAAHPGHDSDAIVQRARAALAAAQPAPVPAGEVAELVADLQECADSCTYASKPYWAAPMRRAAELLAQAHPPAPVPVPVSVQPPPSRRQLMMLAEEVGLPAGDAAAYARAVLARWGRPAQPAPPAEGEVAELVAWLRGANWDRQRQTLATRAAALLSAHPTPPAPVPVSERLPQPEDCDAEGRCWLWNPPRFLAEAGWWEFNHFQWGEGQTHWLPASALPLPTTEEQP